MKLTEREIFKRAMDKVAKCKTKTYGSRSHTKGYVRKKKYLSIYTNTTMKQLKEILLEPPMPVLPSLIILLLTAIFAYTSG